MKVKEETEKVGSKLNIQKTKIMASGPITSWQIDEKTLWQIDRETMETVRDFILRGSKITEDSDCSHEIKRRLLLGKTLWPTCCCCCVISIVSDSMWPHGCQPTRLPCPWDSPDKNTGVGCHFLLKCMKVKSESEVAQSYLTPSTPMD